MDVLVTIQVIDRDAGVVERPDLGGKLPPNGILQLTVARDHETAVSLRLARETSARIGEAGRIRRQGHSLGQVQVDSEGNIAAGRRGDPSEGVRKGGPVDKDADRRYGTRFHGFEDSRIPGFVRPQVVGIDNQHLHGRFTPPARIKRFRKTYFPAPASLKSDRPDARSSRR